MFGFVVLLPVLKIFCRLGRHRLLGVSRPPARSMVRFGERLQGLCKAKSACRGPCVLPLEFGKANALSASPPALDSGAIHRVAIMADDSLPYFSRLTQAQNLGGVGRKNSHFLQEKWRKRWRPGWCPWLSLEIPTISPSH